MRRITAILALAVMVWTVSTALAAEPAVITFGSSGYELQRDIVKLPNGNILVAGDSRQGDKGQKLSSQASMGWVFCLDPTGKVVWERRDGTPGLINLYADPALLDNGNILMKMHTYVKDVLGSERWLLVEMTTEGGLQNTMEVADAEATREILPCAQGYVHLTQEAEKEQSLSLLSREGKQLWRVPRGELMRNPHTALSLPEGTLLLGSKSTFENFATAVLMDGTGAPVWTQTAVLGENSFFDRSLITGEGNILLIGHSSTAAEAGQTLWQIFSVCYTPKGEILWQQQYEEDEKMYKLEDIMPWGDGYLAAGVSHSNSRLKLLALSAQGELKDQWIVRREDTVYSGPELCLLNGEPWVCANVERDGKRMVEFTRAVKAEQ